MPSDNVPPRPPAPLKIPAGLTSDFMKYPYPETEQVLAHLEAFPDVKEETKKCITNLLNYRATRTRARLPRASSAAVLVPLFVGRLGDLYVLLSRRSDALKTFAGDTALPGGRIDAQDVTLEDTARREAFEEVGLPQDKQRVPLLCVMEPHLAKGDILVTPVVVLILDYGLQPCLNSSEVTSIFAQPLISFLSSTSHPSGGHIADVNTPYHSFTDVPWSKGGAVRLHKFLTGREEEGVKPVFGLTAAILIKTATIGYGRTPGFEVQPPNAPTLAQQIAYALLTPANPIHIASKQEGINTNTAAARLLRPSLAANAARTIEWEKIGIQWKKLMDGDKAGVISARIAAAADKASASNRDSTGGGLQKRVDEIKSRIQGRLDDRDGTGKQRLDTIIEKYRQAPNPKEQAEDGGERSQHETLDVAELGEFLDKTRDMVKERMNEIKGDERKLSNARKTYPKIMERVKKRFAEARGDDGDFNPKALSSMIPKEGQEALKGGIKAGKDGIMRGMGQVDGGEVRDHATKRGKEGLQQGLEEMKKYTGKGGDGYDSEQKPSRTRNAKL